MVSHDIVGMDRVLSVWLRWDVKVGVVFARCIVVTAAYRDDGSGTNVAGAEGDQAGATGLLPTCTLICTRNGRVGE